MPRTRTYLRLLRHFASTLQETGGSDKMIRLAFYSVTIGHAARRPPFGSGGSRKGNKGGCVREAQRVRVRRMTRYTRRGRISGHHVRWLNMRTVPLTRNVTFMTSDYVRTSRPKSANRTRRARCAVVKQSRILRVNVYSQVTHRCGTNNSSNRRRVRGRRNYVMRVAPFKR